MDSGRAARTWPVRLEHGPVALRPLRRADEVEWARIRNAEPGWFRMWDSTSPASSGESPITFSQLVTRLNRRARQGQVLPWAVEYTDAGARPRFVGQVTVSGITWGSDPELEWEETELKAARLVGLASGRVVP